jgi:hypothetical protein
MAIHVVHDFFCIALVLALEWCNLFRFTATVSACNMDSRPTSMGPRSPSLHPAVNPTVVPDHRHDSLVKSGALIQFLSPRNHQFKLFNSERGGDYKLTRSEIGSDRMIQILLPENANEKSSLLS